MGNQVSLRPSAATAKIVFWDGSVREYDQPLTVAELMLEHPQQAVVEFHNSALNQKRPIPLPADKKLEMNKVYLLLPMKRGKPVGLSSDETRRILLIMNSKNLKCSLRFLPWLASLCQTTEVSESDPSGRVQRKEEEIEKEERYEFLAEEMLEGVRPEYLSRQLSAKGWKPSLDTIKEKKIEKKVTHWLFLKSV